MAFHHTENKFHLLLLFVFVVIDSAGNSNTRNFIPTRLADWQASCCRYSRNVREFPWSHAPGFIHQLHITRGIADGHELFNPNITTLFSRTQIEPFYIPNDIM